MRNAECGLTDQLSSNSQSTFRNLQSAIGPPATAGDTDTPPARSAYSQSQTAIRLGNAFPSLGIPIPRLGSALPSLGITISGLANAFPSLGIAVSGLGNVIPSLGNAFPSFGSAIPKLRIALPSLRIARQSANNALRDALNLAL